MANSLSGLTSHDSVYVVSGHTTNSSQSEFALQMVVRRELIRADSTTSNHWEKVALKLLPRHASDIAAAILREQADRAAGTWSANDRDASTVLYRCVRADPQGVWQSLTSYRGSPIEALMFSTGFPKGILEKIPVAEIQSWLSVNPEERAAIVVRLLVMNIESDETLASRLLEQYGNYDEVRHGFLDAFVNGNPCTESVSAHWERLAARLEAVARRTTLRRLRLWAEGAVPRLRELAERDREWEEEEEVRGR